jgi:ABC-type lipoprotein export system ATPase subunit
MSYSKYPKGSEWREWDLQIHTPFSALNNGFGSDFDTYAQRMLTLAFEKRIAVIGVTDYFCIEGYKALKNLISDSQRLSNLVGPEVAQFTSQVTFLPNVEFRGFPIPDSEGKEHRVNFHVIFSDDLAIDDIEQRFFLDLRFTIEGNPQGTDEQWALTLANLELVGKRLKAQHKQFQKFGDLYVGMMNAAIDHTKLTKVLENKPSIFKDKYLFCLASDEDLNRYRWDGQGHLTRKILIQKSHLLFTSNGETRLFALGKKHTTPDDFLREFKSLKACVHSSDAHSYERLFEPEGERHTWIKADPTFLGLRQVLNEPEDRVLIGAVPASLERRKTALTRIIDSVVIRKSANASTPEAWFDVSLSLNQELIAVIGNKGSGKSALADVLGLLGNTPRFESFSFLRDDRFRDPKDNKAKQFQTSLTWADSTSEGPISLDKNPLPQSVEKVKYIPQNYLEEICNEISLGKGSRFYSELQQVIFSHVPEAERQGFSSLDELLEYRSEETQRAIDLLVIELSNINKEIVSVEDQLTSQFQRTLESQLNEKRRELESHDKSKPKEIPKPEEDISTKEEAKQTTAQLTKKQETLKSLEDQIVSLRTGDSRLIRQQSIADKLLQRIQTIERQLKKVIEESKNDFEELGLKQEEIISYSINTMPISNRISSIEQERKKIADQLDGKRSESIEKQRLDTVKEIEQLQARLSAPQQNYQNYLGQLKQWQIKRDGIVGNDQLVGSIKYLEKQIIDLADLPKKLSRLQSQRNKKTLEIYREKQKLRDYYSSYYGAVQVFLSQHPIAKTEGFKLTFNVSIVQDRFADSFLQHVHQRKFGPFAGLEEGTGELRRLLDSTNFDSPLGMLRFTRKLFEIMTLHEGKRIEVKDQLLQSSSIVALYDFVFSLGYLSPIYNLRWDKRALEQLSPGERGNLLLIFYLLVDRDDIPLVIDQPEENLDNQTVYKTLVPCIKDAKKRRQIVMVTHNPNLAVVCDAEQVIYSEIQKDRGNTVTYISGSIEDPIINKKVIDVLEGTRPAFDKRDATYSLIK